MLDSWEIGFFGSLEQDVPDWDLDGQSNVAEYIAGTDPTNSASVFIIEGMSAPTLYWTARPDRTYSVYWTEDLSQPFIRIAVGLKTGSYTDTRHAGGSSYYRIEVEMD